MDRVKLLYGALSKSETKALKTYITAFHSKGENKPLELLRLIEKKPELTADIAASKLYNNPRSKAFIMMKARLYEKMTEFITLSVNPASHQYSKEMPYFRDLIDYRKSMLIATSLQEKRLGRLAHDYFDRCLKLARNCNTPELEVDVLIRLRAINKSPGKDFESLSAEIRRALSRQEMDINAIGIYHKFYGLHTLRTAGDDKKIEFLEKHVPDLAHALRQEYSSRADYYVQMLRINLFSLRGDYEACKGAVENAIRVVKENEGLRTRQRMSDPWFQWGMMELKFHNYEDAEAAFVQAQSTLKPTSRAYIVTSIMMLYAYIYLEKIDLAASKAEDVDKLINRTGAAPNPMLHGLFAYLQACIHYKKGEYQKAWFGLQQLSELNFDKGGWITGIRIFEIQIHIDRDQPDIAAQKLENLRKHISRYPSDDRSNVIYRLLYGQEKQGFSFGPFKQETELLQELAILPRKHIGHEVIRFDNWYKRKRGIPTD